MQRKLIGLLTLVTLAQMSSALAQSSAPLPEDDPAVWTARAARAASLREESTRLRDAANAQRASEDLACRKKFWENMCKDGARERWIEQINKVRAMEIEAVGLERNQRAHEVAMRAKERASNPPKPLVLPDASAPSAQSGGAARKGSPAALDTKPAEPSKPLGKPVDARKQAEQQSQRAQEREEEVKKAADRAAQAKEDKARYAERAREHAKKEAERKAKTAGQSSPLASQPK